MSKLLLLVCLGAALHVPSEKYVRVDAFVFDGQPRCRGPPRAFQRLVTNQLSVMASGDERQEEAPVPMNTSPFPAMPSRTFVDLAQNQFELLASSITYPSVAPTSSPSLPSASKIKSIALYSPQENAQTGALEFVPTALYPCPTTERMFIAGEVGSGLPPTMPKTLAALPGFTHAQNLLPAYPFASTAGSAAGSGDAAVGAVEEVFCDISAGNRGGGSALSVPLYSGSRTVGVILVWPSEPPTRHPSASKVNEDMSTSTWTKSDKEQIVLAARSVAMALSMDADRAEMRMRNQDVRLALENNLHQIKNPLQAMRTYSKVLQRHIALEEDGLDEMGGFDRIGGGRAQQSPTARLLALAENMMVQSERVVDLLAPMDSIVDALEDDNAGGVPLLGPAPPPPEPPGALVFSAARRHTEDLAPKERRRANGKKKSTANSNDGAAAGDIDANKVQSSAGPSAAPPVSKLAPTSVASLGTMELEIAFVADVLEPIITASKVIAEERGIKFEIEGMGEDAELPGVSVCPKYLQEAVGNLLENAIKYVVLGKRNGRGLDAPKNSSPHIRISLTPNHEPYKAGVTILIEDNGPGIPPEDKEAVFIRGYRGDAARLVPGSGIGLDISKSMFEQMGAILDIVDGEQSMTATDRDMLNGTVMRIVLFRSPKII